MKHTNYRTGNRAEDLDRWSSCMQATQTLKTASVIQPQNNDALISKLYGLIEDNLDEPLFNVEELVILTGISRTSLHRKVKALSGLTTSELIRNYRLKRATAFLSEGLPSTVVANKTGFSSPAYFTKCFRELYGMTPGEFVRLQINS